jgi:hypothetical protein
MKDEELVLKMARNIVRNLQRTRDSIKRLSAGLTSEGALKDAEGMIQDLKDILGVLKGLVSIGQAKKAGGKSLFDEVSSLIVQFRSLNVQADIWQDTKKKFTAFKEEIDKRKTILICGDIKKLFAEIKTVLICFHKFRLKDKAKEALRNILRKISLVIIDIDKFISEMNSWQKGVK